MTNWKNKYFELYWNKLTNKQLIEQIENNLKEIDRTFLICGNTNGTYNAPRAKKEIIRINEEAKQFIKELKRRTKIHNTSKGVWEHE